MSKSYDLVCQCQCCHVSANHQGFVVISIKKTPKNSTGWDREPFILLPLDLGAFDFGISQTVISKGTLIHRQTFLPIPSNLLSPWFE